MSERIEKYIRNHKDRKNLLIHIVFVPGFIISHFLIIYAIFVANYYLVGFSLFLLFFSFSIQGNFHKNEENKADKFKGPFDFIKRIYIEQFISFPEFVIRGYFWKNFR